MIFSPLSIKKLNILLYRHDCLTTNWCIRTIEKEQERRIKPTLTCIYL